MAVRRVWRCVVLVVVLVVGTVLMPLSSSAEPAGGSGLTGAEGVASRLAVAGGSAVVVEGSTTSHSRVVALPDGSFSLSTSRSAVRVWRDGEWLDVDPSLVVGVDGLVRPAVVMGEVVLSGGGVDQPLVFLQQGAGSLALRVPFDLPVPRVVGSEAVYVDVLDGVDLVVNVTGESVSEVLRVKTPQALADPRLARLGVVIEASGLALEVDTDGSSVAKDADGEVVFAGGVPTMWDSSVLPGGQRPSAVLSGETERVVPVEVRSQGGLARGAVGGSTEVTLAPVVDAGWEFPVFIDPSFSSARMNFAVVRQNKSTYWNNAENFRVGYCAWAGCEPYFRARSYFAMDISAIRKRDGMAAQVMAAEVTVHQVHNASSAYACESSCCGEHLPGRGVAGSADELLVERESGGGCLSYIRGLRNALVHAVRG